MKILFLTHPNFFNSQSMPRFANMLADGMKRRGHTVQVISPKPYFFRLSFPDAVKKWLGYIDQYIIFPRQLRRLLKKEKDILVVFTDQALGPWVPIASQLPHVIHCHDFLAQRSALGEIKENPTGITGRLYQAYIRYGYTKGRNFISVSQRTQQDLHRFMPDKPALSRVVYNGMNRSFSCHLPEQARASFGKRVNLDLASGYLLHVGGNSWYKNRRGIIEIYDAYRSKGGEPLPLLFVGESPEGDVLLAYQSSPYKQDIYFFQGIEDKYVQYAYSGACVFLFPSLAEGFGWPIAEAMACGCPVITTNETPMTEVAGKAAFLIERRPADGSGVAEWAHQSAEILRRVIALTEEERADVKSAGLENVLRFNSELALDQIESIYKEVCFASHTGYGDGKVQRSEEDNFFKKKVGNTL